MSMYVVYPCVTGLCELLRRVGAKMDKDLQTTFPACVAQYTANMKTLEDLCNGISSILVGKRLRISKIKFI